MITRAFLFLAWLLHFLPQGVLARIGTLVGRVAYYLIPGRRHVVLVNLERCFPELDPNQRMALAREHFRRLGRALLELTIAWWGSADRVRRLVNLVNVDDLRALQANPEAAILLAPHFIGMELGGAVIALDLDAAAIYSRQSNKVMDAFIIGRRTRVRPTQLISRQDGIKPAIRALKGKRPLFFPGDLDFGPRDAVFAPFFGVPAATITALPRLAKITNARVLVVVIEQLGMDEGYRCEIVEPFPDFPSGDVEADVARVNAFIEKCVRPMPAQYYWVHKRFKTRPPGERKFY